MAFAAELKSVVTYAEPATPVAPTEDSVDSAALRAAGKRYRSGKMDLVALDELKTELGL